MLIFTGLLRVLRRLPGDRVDVVPGLGEHLPEPDDPRLDHDGDHDGLRRRLHRRVLREQGRPVLDDLRRPGGRDRGVGRRGRLRTDARLPDLDADRRAGRLRRRLDRDQGARRRRGRGGGRPRVSRASSGCCGSAYSPRATRPASTTSSRRSAASSWAWRPSSRSASCPAGGRVDPQELNVLRVPLAVELAGLDVVEYGTLVYPEMSGPRGDLSPTARWSRRRRCAARQRAAGPLDRGGDLMLSLPVASSSCSPSSARPCSGPCARSAGATQREEGHARHHR